MLKKGGRLDWVVFSESVSAFCLLLCVVLCSLFREAPSDPHSLREIRRDSTLCFGVLVNPMEYYVYQGKVGGFAYALGNAMADTWGVSPVYQVYYTYEDVCMALIQNEIDVMAVAEQASPEGCLFFAYTRPVMYTDVLRVRHKDSLSDAPCSMGLVASPALVEAAAAVPGGRPDAFYWRFYRASGDQLLEAVEEGKLATTLSFGRYWHAFSYQYPHVCVCDTLSRHLPLRWAVRKGNDTLLAAVNAFLRDYSRTADWARLHKKYTDPESKERKRIAYTLSSQPFGSISRYDKYFKQYGEAYRMDWHLLASLVYQESKFRHNIVGKGNTYGLMQFAPVTASRYGVGVGSAPEKQIQSGCLHLHHLQLLLMREGVWDSAQLVPMVIAAYNAGGGHLTDAIALARAEGLNPRVWEPHGVQEALLMLGERKYARHPAVRNGSYAGGRHTVRYVQSVLERNEAYKAVIRRDSLTEIR